MPLGYGRHVPTHEVGSTKATSSSNTPIHDTLYHPTPLPPPIQYAHGAPSRHSAVDGRGSGSTHPSRGQNFENHHLHNPRHHHPDDYGVPIISNHHQHSGGGGGGGGNQASSHSGLTARATPSLSSHHSSGGGGGGSYPVGSAPSAYRGDASPSFSAIGAPPSAAGGAGDALSDNGLGGGGGHGSPLMTGLTFSLDLAGYDGGIGAGGSRLVGRAGSEGALSAHGNNSSDFFSAGAVGGGSSRSDAGADTADLSAFSGAFGGDDGGHGHDGAGGGGGGFVAGLLGGSSPAASHHSAGPLDLSAMPRQLDIGPSSFGAGGDAGSLFSSFGGGGSESGGAMGSVSCLYVPVSFS